MLTSSMYLCALTNHSFVLSSSMYFLDSILFCIITAFVVWWQFLIARAKLHWHFLKLSYSDFSAQYVHQDVQTAKMIATGDVAKLDTKHLFDKYLSTESPSEVNISSSLKTRITTLIDVKNGCGAVEPSEIKHQELFQSLESAQAEVKVMVTWHPCPLLFLDNAAVECSVDWWELTKNVTSSLFCFWIHWQFIQFKITAICSFYAAWWWQNSTYSSAKSSHYSLSVRCLQKDSNSLQLYFSIQTNRLYLPLVLCLDSL